MKEGMMWLLANCNKCGCKPEPPYTNSKDKTVLCEKCACKEYKKSIGYQIDKSGIFARKIFVTYLT